MLCGLAADASIYMDLLLSNIVPPDRLGLLQVQPPYWAQLQEDLQDACHLPDADAFEEALHGAPSEQEGLEGHSPRQPHQHESEQQQQQQQQQHARGRDEAVVSDGASDRDEHADGGAEPQDDDHAEYGSTGAAGDQAAEEGEEAGSEEPDALPPMLFYGVCGQQVLHCTPVAAGRYGQR